MSLKRIVIVVMGCALLAGCASPVFSTPTVLRQPTAASTGVSTVAPSATAAPSFYVDVYKTIDEVQLEAHVFLPPGHLDDDARPAFLFFHGGGWYEGEPENGYRLCEYWAQRGLVAISFEYRLADFEDITPVESLMDVKSAVRWVRSHAGQLGVDPGMIVATGGSAGGHLAISTAMIAGYEEDALNVSSVPDAVVVWSAPVNLSVDSWFAQLLGGRTEVDSLSPIRQVRPDLPPMRLLHGIEDETVPYWTVEEFADEMQRAGNRCELISYEGGHLFHVDQRTHVLGMIEEFLVSLGYID